MTSHELDLATRQILFHYSTQYEHLSYTGNSAKLSDAVFQEVVGGKKKNAISKNNGIERGKRKKII